jgi:histidyl-tRNA synthetase
MNKIQPRLPKGMRDILPADMQRRHHVIRTITDVFETFGFEPIQTPVMELNEILMGKYGEDAEKLIYHAAHPGSDDELALRYDLTVPLTRFYAMHENDLTLPFKRYHIAPVWRAERPQQGRFREFYQCDADIIGIPGRDADAEVIAVTVTGIQRLGFRDFVTKINSRSLLTAIGQFAGVEGVQLSNLYRTIDKADKIGLDGVRAEFLKNGMPEAMVSKLLNLIAAAQGQTGIAVGRRTVGYLREEMGDLQIAQDALNELDALLDNLELIGGLDQNIGLDFTMVRGLSYYTGPIFETVLISDDPEERVGSVSGGGRYDDMIGMFRKESLPTVGTSFGIERLIHIMNTREMYPSTLGKTVVQVLVSVFSPEMRAASVSLAMALRNAGVHTELYMQDKALGKQFTYADKKGVPLVGIVGPDESVAGVVKFKRLSDAKEVTVNREQAADAVRELLTT